MGWPWLDVAFWATCVGVGDDEDAAAIALGTAFAVHDPARIGDMMGAEPQKRDTRTRDEIIAAVISAEARGWN